MYNQRIFCSVTNTLNGEVSSDTIFHYHQQDQIVWADYSGRSIIKGFLTATVQENNRLAVRYQHVNTAGELMTGRCYSNPKQLADGRIRPHESWQWTSGNGSTGESIVEEVFV